ncbi:hypothetical protein HDU67_000396, partial [Dinochytrium kinnereticum]
MHLTAIALSAILGITAAQKCSKNKPVVAGGYLAAPQGSGSTVSAIASPADPATTVPLAVTSMTTALPSPPTLPPVADTLATAIPPPPPLTTGTSVIDPPTVSGTATVIIPPVLTTTTPSQTPSPTQPTTPPSQSWWKPAQRVQWQWHLDSFTPTSIIKDTAADTVTVYDIDLYTEKSTIDYLKSQGKKVVCYFEAGTWVKERPFSSLYPKEALGRSYEAPYENELWLDVSNAQVREVFKTKILPFAKEQGCDAVEPDNTQGFERDSYCTGFEKCESSCSGPSSSWSIEKVCKADYDVWLDFNRFLATEAHALGLGIAMKNNRYQASSLVDEFDFVLNEQCLTYKECEDYEVFVKKGKAVLLVEYDVPDLGGMCAAADKLGFSAMQKSTAL